MTNMLTVYGTTNDGHIYGQSTDYATARGTASIFSTTSAYILVGQQISGDIYSVYNDYLKFPSSDISSSIYDRTAYARLGLTIYNSLGIGFEGTTSNFDVDIIKQDWSAHDPLTSTDIEIPYNECLTSTKDVTWHEFTSSTAAADTTFYSPPLDLDWISPTTDNYYSLRLNRVKDANEPSGYERVVLCSSESTDASYRPALQFIYLDPSGDAIDYFLGVDWNNDTTLDDGNEAENMVKYKIDRGRRRFVGRAGGGFEPYKVGKLNLVLDNSDGRYNPWNTSSPLYGNLTPGKRMKFTCSVVSSTSESGYARFDLFTGYTSKLIPRGWNQTVTLECEDGLGILKHTENYITNENDTEPYYTVENLFDNVLDFVNYPYSRDISTADPTSDIFAAHLIMLKDDGLSSVEDVTNGAIGTIAAEGDGTFAYHSIYESDTSEFTFTDGIVSRTPYFPNPWEYKRDATKLGAEYWLFPLGSQMFDFVTTDTPLTIGAGDMLTKEFSYIDTNATYPGNWYGGAYPSTNFNVFVSTSADVTGSTATTDISYETTIYPEKLVFSITNSAAFTQYVNKFNINLGITWKCLQYEALNFNFGTTNNDWTNQEFALNSPYFSMIARGYTDGYYSDYYPVHSSDYFGTTNITKVQKARIETLGELLDNYLSTTDHVFPILQIEGRPDNQFTIDVEKKVTYLSNLLGTTDDYRICGLTHQSLDTPQSVRSTYYLYPVIPSTT